MNRNLRFALILLALLLPAMSLAALGGVWLWQNGMMLYWALGACLLSLAVYGFQLWMLRPQAVSSTSSQSDKILPGGSSTKQPVLDDGAARGSETDVPYPESDVAIDHAQVDPGWTPAEQQAWQAVLAIAEDVDLQGLKDRQAFFDLGYKTVEAVALSLHPKETNPLLRFTLPEALALVERVAGRLRPFIIETIPLGDRLTVGQFVRIYNWRSVAGFAGQAYDLWRLIRLMNPATAATQEMRERISREFYNWGRDALARKFARRFVEEVGQAAIELYGGRLKLSPQELAAKLTEASSRDRAELEQRTTEPLRILIAGQTGSGKSSVINALSNELQAATDVLPATKYVTPYAIERDGLHAAMFLDTPGLTGELHNLNQLLQTSADCDLILWVVAANRADRQLDREAVQAIASKFAAEPHRRRPAMLTVMTKIDTLRPFAEWDPPYDLGDSKSVKGQTILSAMAEVSQDTGFDIEQIIPVSTASIDTSYNIEALWSAIYENLPEADAARLVRCLGAERNGLSWSRLGSQLRAAGRMVSRNIIG